MRVMLDLPVIEARARLVRFGPFVFDTQNRLLSRNGADLPLPPRVLGVLELLLSRPGEIVSRQELHESVWKDAYVTDTSLAEAISFLRQALGDDPQNPRFVQTVHRRGYRFLPALVIPDEQPPAAASVESIPRPSIARELLPWSIAILCSVLAGAALWRLARQPAPEAPPLVRFPVMPEPGTSFDARAPAFAVSKDGRVIVWSACDASQTSCALYVRPLDRNDATRMPGTDNASAPFFSPDGRWVGFFADGKVKKTSIAGGSAITLAAAPDPGGADWSSDGHIVFAGASGGGLSIVSDQGGDAVPLTAPRIDRGEVRHAWPAWLPRGAGLVFTVAGSPLPGASTELALLTLPSRAIRVLRGGASRGLTSAPGYLLASVGADLEAITFDARALAMTGGADTVWQRLAIASGVPQFAVSSAGTAIALERADAPRRVSWADAPETPVEGLERFHSIALSPDGRRAAGVVPDGSGSDIWVADVSTGALTRVTYGGVNVAPVWSADGRELIFARKGSSFGIAADALDGRGPHVIASADTHVFPTSAASDGRIAITRMRPGERTTVGILSRSTGRIEWLAEGPFDERAAAFSPDGAWLALESDESGTWQIVVRRVADGSRMTISSGGMTPSWSAGGKSILFHDGDRLLRASFAADGQPRAGKPETAFERGDARVIGLTARGRLLVEHMDRLRPARVAVQWLRDVRQRVPAPVTAPR
jgi:eukaryotic-like serine/threonine-protein kinase